MFILIYREETSDLCVEVLKDHKSVEEFLSRLETRLTVNEAVLPINEDGQYDLLCLRPRKYLLYSGVPSFCAYVKE